MTDLKPAKDAYYASRYTADTARPIVWKEIVRFLRRYIAKDAVVVDLGAGYCDFINNVTAAKRYAVDTSPEFDNYVGKGVQAIHGLAWELGAIPDGSVDIVHASNLLEHFLDSELDKVMAEIRRVLKPKGRLILLQPNYRLATSHYFDDPTHRKVFSDAGMESFLISHNFSIVLKKARFLPFSMRSRGIIPVFPLLVRAYIYSPFKPFAGQMLFIAEKR